jgi:hypothetical protein
MAEVQVVLGLRGPLPVSASADIETDGPVALTIAGSVWTTMANTNIGFSLYIDGQPPEYGAMIFANTPGSHMAVVPITVPYTFTIGTHKFELAPMNPETASDENDFFIVTVLY